jgi:hypothetical protein
MTGKNRIMIYGPKADDTYVIEFKTAAGEALAIFDPENRDGSDPALPRAYALWPLRAGYSGRNLCCPRCFQRTLLPPICHREDVFCCSRSRCAFFLILLVKCPYSAYH